MDMLDACCSSNEHSAISAENIIDEKILKDDLYLNDKHQFEEAWLSFHDQNYIEKIKEFQFYLDTVSLSAKSVNLSLEYVEVKKIVKPGCSQEVLNVALTSMSSLVKMLSMMSSGPYPLASL